jgi:hypothetical protein
LRLELSTFMWRALIIASICLPLAPRATAQERPAVTDQAKPLPQPRARLPTNCATLTAMLTQIDQMKELQTKAKKEQAAPPPDLLSAWQRAFGKKDEVLQHLRT